MTKRIDIVALALVVGLSAAPALAASGTSSLLDPGIKALEAGKTEQAIKAFTSVLSPKTPAPDLARAYYLRGLAYRKAKKPAQAIADFTHALWLKSLGEEDKAAALKNRAEAYGEVGLADRSRASERETRLASATAADTEATAPGQSGDGSWDATTVAPDAPSLGLAPTSDPGLPAGTATTAPASGSGSSLFGSNGFFGSLFSGSGSTTASQKSQTSASRAFRARGDEGTAPDAKVAVLEATATQSEASAWTATAGPEVDPSGDWQAAVARERATVATPATTSRAPPGEPATDVQSFFGSIFGGGQDTAPAAKSEETASAAPGWNAATTHAATPGVGEALPWQTAETGAPAAAAAGQGYRLQVASVRSEAEAKAVLDQIAAADSEALAGIGSFVEPSVLGNMGTFYQVQLGPFADERSSLKTCNRLRRSGVDCFLVAK